MLKKTSKAALQEQQYSFPYHYLATLQNGRFSQHKVIGSGFEYLSYSRHVADVLETLSWESLVDIGCGDGRLLSILVDRFPDRTLTGLDCSERAINFARALNPELSFTVGNAEDGPAAFDAATCIDVIEHIEPAHLPRFISGIRGQLREGGKLVATVPSVNRPVSRKHYQHFTAQMLRAVLERHFRITATYYVNDFDWSVRLMKRLLVNRLFVLNEPRLISALFRWYERGHSRSTPERGVRVVAIGEAV